MKLPLKFRPKYSYDLIRIGSKHDGGYLIEKTSYDKSKFLFSFGVSTNWDFEKDFIKKNKINFLAFDGSINNEFWLRKRKIALDKVKSLSFKKIFEYFYLKKSFKSFFNNKNFYSKFISNSLKNSITFDTALSLSNIKNDLFFKIDIEGSEYDFLDDLIKNQDKINGLAIEFHQCNANLDKLLDFIVSFKLDLVHIHANNYDNLNNKIIPDTLEISFSKNPRILNGFQKLPHRLDSPNRSKNKEIQIDFDD
tara:strand:+ start:3771 stop:4523 length:753 start_codon:yes stop_codon:yes gene_type:complete